MAGHGNTIPKDPQQRRRRNADPVATTYVSEDGQLRGPALPLNRDWPVETKAWWTSWRASAQSQTFTKSDWDFLLDTALLHAALWQGNLTAATELRLRLSKFGATPEDRARLRMHVRGPEADEPAKPDQAPGGRGRYGHLRAVEPPSA